MVTGKEQAGFRVRGREPQPDRMPQVTQPILERKGNFPHHFGPLLDLLDQLLILPQKGLQQEILLTPEQAVEIHVRADAVRFRDDCPLPR